MRLMQDAVVLVDPVSHSIVMKDMNGRLFEGREVYVGGVQYGIERSRRRRKDIALNYQNAENGEGHSNIIFLRCSL